MTSNEKKVMHNTSFRKDLAPPCHSVILVSDQDKLNEMIAHIQGSTHLGIDIESDILHKYNWRTCLLQLATPEKIFLVDLLQFKSIATNALKSIFEDENILKIFHAAENDLEWLNRDYGFIFKNVFDTALAAKFIGLRNLGLVSIAEKILEVTLEKDKYIQKSDWSYRPLSQENLRYAAQDVQYLIALAKNLQDKLKGIGIYSFFRGECRYLESIRYIPISLKEAWKHVKGGAVLNLAEQKVLQELYEVRDAMARKRNVPVHFIANNRLLITAAQCASNFMKSGKGLPAKGANPNFIKQLPDIVMKSWDENLLPTQQSPEGVVSKKEERKVQKILAKKNLEKLRAWRKFIAEKIKLAHVDYIIWPSKHLKLLASNTKDTDFFIHRDRYGRSVVRDWQYRNFGQSLHIELISREAEFFG